MLPSCGNAQGNFYTDLSSICQSHWHEQHDARTDGKRRTLNRSISSFTPL